MGATKAYGGKFVLHHPSTDARFAAGAPTPELHSERVLVQLAGKTIGEIWRVDIFHPGAESG